MNRSVYDNLLTLFTARPRARAIGQVEIQDRLEQTCGIVVHRRHLQSLVDELASQQQWCIIGEACGYWRFKEDSSAEELEAAWHSVNTLRAHGQAEIDKANLRAAWIELLSAVQQHQHKQEYDHNQARLGYD